jgi:N-acetylmuramoyl-L-alanine amidase
MRHLDSIYIHCTATRAEWWADRRSSEKAAECKRWHLDRGWSDIGYHYLIDRDGTITEGRPIEKTPAAQKGHNTGSVAIALWGGHGGSQHDSFEDHFTPEQDRALRMLIAQRRMEYPSITKVRGHNEVSAKQCPCFQVTPWMNGTETEKKPARKRISQTKTVRSSTVAKLATLASPATIATVGGLEWQKLLIMGVFALVAMMALGIIDLERLKKWELGDR